MPPENPTPIDPKDHLLPPAHKSSSGPIVGIIIILALLLLGGWYFWNESQRNVPEAPLPLIPADESVSQG
ncbi:hypothetical protein COU18_00510 [Candidatus Kaiserbacteria bacterium CG10_big_fil_rev_8_21_14_0_10_51_14]|uniref:Uncharacterized protein n=1 Tax=Candidatus Kaiserbacteria bacterium CG10_big_fil_rev_8_21_14_0_10_51_14 TaxID=1974610 RepID=A0A2H0UCT1_9BACT|nr:MAG: hypothetical protein COU18_00510 [Candidatus Kaiserbacteria bacterium CG10_big_fil_rev_8_21_14_0_10_51_14]